MKHYLLPFGMLVISYIITALGAQEDRENMVTEVVKVNGSMFRSYGCYCGIEGVGTGEAKDYIDICCQILNCCYQVLKLSKCFADTTRYKYTYDGDAVECYMANRASYCKAKVCNCDKFYTVCLLDSHGLFNKNFIPSGRRDCAVADPPKCAKDLL